MSKNEDRRSALEALKSDPDQAFEFVKYVTNQGVLAPDKEIWLQVESHAYPSTLRTENITGKSKKSARKFKPSVKRKLKTVVNILALLEDLNSTARYSGSFSASYQRKKKES